MKGGTTSLFAYLCQHPELHGSFQKEVHFFDDSFSKGTTWYRKHFSQREDGVLIEATPEYMFLHASLERIQSTVPSAKIVCVLRHPVARAYSHYQHACRRGFFRNESFEEAVVRYNSVLQDRVALGHETRSDR